MSQIKVCVFGRTQSQIIRGVATLDENRCPQFPLEEMEVLTSSGWIPCGWRLTRYFNSGRVIVTTFSRCLKRMQRACCDVPPHALPLELGQRQRWRYCWLVWLVFPPLGQGAGRWLTASGRSTFELARDSFSRSLGEKQLTDALVSQAETGYAQTYARMRGIEDRAKLFFSAAGVTSTLVLANSALLFDDKLGIDGTARGVLIAAISVGSVSLLLAGIQAMWAFSWTSGRIHVNAPNRVVERSKLDDKKSRLVYVAALLAAQRRLSIVADWKIGRMRSATTCFMVAIVAIVFATGSLVYEAIDSDGPDKSAARLLTPVGS